ncbi:MAG TPA: sulfotransferase domain-containing protein [Verrucomicrobiae bacterium]|nr:sulfotransferase domain-containing protein [Verrucomicrobiae bacterium]
MTAQARESVARLLRTHTLPACLIIGAQKAGTTSLASYLFAHPSVVSPSFKEVHFFDLNYAKGPEWYGSQFPIGGRRRVANQLQGRTGFALDATPYYLLHPLAAERARKLVPAAKIIILLRDPVDRAYSHYHHERRLGHEHLPFEEALACESSRTADEAERLQREPSYESFNYQHFTYLERGIYANQIRRWRKFFPSEQLLILSSEELFEDGARVYRRVLGFLGLPALDLAAYPAEHVGKYRPMAARMRDRLDEFYAPHNRVLREELNAEWPGVGDTIVDRFSVRSRHAG